MSAFSAIDLSKLPPLQLVEEPGFEANYDRLKALYLQLNPAAADIINLDSTAEAKIMQIAAIEISRLQSEINLSGQAVTLAQSTGSDLDNLAVYTPLERHEGESDDDFRARIQLAPEGFSSAGPAGAYEFHARSAHSGVLDVKVTSPQPGQVRVFVLVPDTIDQPEVLSAIEARLSADDVRPLTDHVLVQAAQAVPFNIEAELTIGSGPSPALVLGAAVTALEAYLTDRYKIGRSVTKAGLCGALMVPGVENLNLIQPENDIVPDVTEVARANSVSVVEAAHA